jgi:hypothetical protein
MSHRATLWTLLTGAILIVTSHAAQITSPLANSTWDVSRNQTVTWTFNQSDPKFVYISLTQYVPPQRNITFPVITEIDLVENISIALGSYVISPAAFSTKNFTFLQDGPLNWTLGIFSRANYSAVTTLPWLTLVDSTNPFRFEIQTSPYIYPAAGDTAHQTLVASSIKSTIFRKLELSRVAWIGIGVASGILGVGLVLAFGYAIFQRSKRVKWRKSGQSKLDNCFFADSV